VGRSVDERATETFGHLVREFLEAAHLVPPDQLPSLGERVAADLGVVRMGTWLADYPQRVLVPFPTSTATPIAIDTTVGGRAFLRGEPVEVSDDDGIRLWVPLIDGVDRIGVLDAVLDTIDDHARQVLHQFASAVAAETVARGQYTDAFKRARRRRDMTLSAELQWELLPPTTFSTPTVTISGALEPAYDVGGDSFDYTYDDGILRFVILDAVGHDLRSSVLASLTLGAYRHARRSGEDLVGSVRELDEVIRDQFEGTTYVTALLAELDVATGIVRWVNAGHPSPLLLRQMRVVAVMEGERRVPLGLGHMTPHKRTPVVEEHLEPDDMLLLYSDGLTEARTARGVDFGLDRLGDFLERSVASGLPPAEITRRLSHAVLDHHGGTLKDDATTLLLQWHPHGRLR
jgi:serine phosphatase RsbU (regulator of sigma subunit)